MQLAPAISLITPLAGFTGSDWFQITYPLVLFVLAFLIPQRRSGSTNAQTEQHVQTTLSVNAAVHAPIHLITAVMRHAPPTPASREPGRRRPARRSSSLDGDEGVGLLLITGIAGTLVSAFLYLRFGEPASLVIGAFLALSAGLLCGSIVAAIRSRSLALDWLLLAGSVFTLIAFAVYCGWLLLHPSSAPAGYAAITAAYLQEPSALNAFDDTTKLLANQGFATVLLLLAALLILALASALYVKAKALHAGSPGSARQRRIIRMAGSPGDVFGATLFVGVCLAFSFVLAGGYAYRLTDDASQSSFAPAKILTPSLSRSGSALSVSLVCTRGMPVRMTVKARFGGRLLRRSTRRCDAGGNTALLRLRRPSKALRVTLTPLPAVGTAGDRRTIDFD